MSTEDLTAGLSDGTEDVLPEQIKGVSVAESLNGAFDAAGEQSSGEGDWSAELAPGDAAPPGGQSSAPPGGVAAQPQEAPAHWSAADRDMFAKQTPEAQQWMMQRSRAMEAAHTRRSQELAQQRQTLAPYEQLAQRWGAYFQQLGAPPDYAIDRLLQTEHALRTGTNAQKLELMKQLIRDYGVTAPGEGEQMPMSMPEDPRIGQLQGQLQQMQAQQMQAQQNQQRAQVQQASSAIQVFATRTGEDGKLLHPHFGEVEGEMTRLAQVDLMNGIQPN